MKEIRNEYFGKMEKWAKKEPSKGRFQVIVSFVAFISTIHRQGVSVIQLPREIISQRESSGQFLRFS